MELQKKVNSQTFTFILTPITDYTEYYERELKDPTVLAHLVMMEKNSQQLVQILIIKYVFGTGNKRQSF